MANDIEFKNGFKNLAVSAASPGDMIELELTPYLRDSANGSVLDYAYFTSQSNNTYYTNTNIYMAPGESAQNPAVVDIPGFFPVKITRADLHTNYTANVRYQVYNVKIGTDPNNKTWYLYVDFWFTGKNGNVSGSVDHFNYEFGLRDGASDSEATNYKIFRTEDTGFLNPPVTGRNEPFFTAGCGYINIPDTFTTIPENQRFLFAVYCEVQRPTATNTYPLNPLPLPIYWTSQTTRSTGFPAYDTVYTGNPNWSTSFIANFKFVDIPKMITSLSLTPELDYLVDVSPEAGPASGEDGMDDPSFDDSSDTVDIPAAPTLGVTNVGFVNVYKTGANSLQNMGVELFPPLTYTAPTPITGVDETDAIVNGFNSIVTFLANIPSFFEQMVANTLINYIIDCHMIPVTPTGGTPEAIKVGYKTMTTASGNRLSSDYVDVDCGSISLAEYYQNFADFLETVKLYLPFVGFVPARPEWFKRTSLGVKYRFNIVDGSFIAWVMSSGRYVNNNNSGKTIVGQYSGNACVHLPITGVTYSNMVSGIVGATGGAAASAGSGNIAAATTSVIAAATARGDIPQSNSYSASASFMGCRRPFLLIERPVSNYSKSYQKELGIPSNITKKLGNLTGFAMVGDIHLDGIDATDQEKLEIEKLLRSGVIL